MSVAGGRNAMARQPKPPINCEDCPFFSGGYFAGFRCEKGHAAEPSQDLRFKFVRVSCIDFRPMTEAEKIKRRWRYAKADNIKNKGVALKRLAGSLRNQVQPEALGQYMTSGEIADLLSAAATLTRIAGHIGKAATMLKEDERSAVEFARQESIMVCGDAARRFFGADAQLADLPQIAFDLSAFLHAALGYVSSEIEYAAKQLDAAVRSAPSDDEEMRVLRGNNLALLKSNLMQAVGREVRGFRDIGQPHYIASTNKLTVSAFETFHEAQTERRRVEAAVAASANVVAMKKMPKKK